MLKARKHTVSKENRLASCYIIQYYANNKDDY